MPRVAASPVEKPVPGGDEAPPNRGACAGPRARSGRAEPCCPWVGTGVLLAGAGEAEGNEMEDVIGDRLPKWKGVCSSGIPFSVRTAGKIEGSVTQMDAYW